MSFDMHKLALTIGGANYEVPAIALTDEQVRHMVAYAARVKIERAAAGKADDQEKAHAARQARIATVYDIDGTQRRSPVETEAMNLLRTWLRQKGEKAENTKLVTDYAKAETFARAFLPDSEKGTTEERAANLVKVMITKAEEIVAARGGIEADV